MKIVEIGEVELFYNEDGKVTKSSFTPTMKINLDENLINQLHSIESNKNSEVIKHNAEIMLASFFSKINEIELADRDYYHIESEVMKCDKYPTGIAKYCKIKFIFKPINSKTS